MRSTCGWHLGRANAGETPGFLVEDFLCTYDLYQDNLHTRAIAMAIVSARPALQGRVVVEENGGHVR